MNYIDVEAFDFSMKRPKETISQVQRLIDEWCYEKNNEIGLNPELLGSQSNKSAWWHCAKCHYEWFAKINNRYNGRGCPCCARKIVVPGVNDLATTHPKLAAEWDYVRNGDLTPNMVLFGTRQKVYWLCPEGHSYKADINHRSTNNGTNCPICNAGRQTSFAEQAVYFYVKKVFPDAINRYKDIFDNAMELDIYIPSLRLGVEYDGEAWHRDDKLEKDRRKYNICQKNNIRLIRLMEKDPDVPMVTENGMLFLTDETISVPGHMYEHDELEKVIRILLNKIDPESNMWTRKCFSSFNSNVDIDIKRDEKQIRSFMTVLKRESLAELYPEIAKEWHTSKNDNVTPDKVKPGSDIKAWWTCSECGRDYECTIGHRTGKNGTGCQDCGIRKSAAAKSRAVNMIDLETGAIIKSFPSISEAARQMNMSSGNITAVCKNKRSKAGGYGWKYVLMQ